VGQQSRRKLKLATLGLPTPQSDRFPLGCPILKALLGRQETALEAAVKAVCELDESNPDLVLVPTNIRFYEGPERELLLKTLRTSGLPSLGFDIAAENKKPEELTYIVRFSWYRSEKETGTIICPPIGQEMTGWADKSWKPLPKGQRASVGFCGRTGTKVAQTLWEVMPREAARWMATVPALGRTKGARGLCGAPLRRDAFQILRGDNRIELKAIDRGAVLHRPGSQGPTRAEYRENLVNNQYSLCGRGSDNYSYRFYETLAAGRIPVLIDTDCLLPMEGKIDWERLVIRIPCRNLDSIATKIAEHHNRTNEKDFADLQIQIKETAEQLKPERFLPEMLIALTQNR